jgi:hypothetical protein
MLRSVSPELLSLIAALGWCLFYFGPSILRALLRPERGTPLDLRIAWLETFLNDADKRGRIGEKLAALATKDAASPVVPSPPAPDTERITVPPAPPPENEP